MPGPFVELSTVPVGTPVLVAATIGERRWWGRVRQFRRNAYVEVWNDAGFDAEAVVPTDDVAGAMTAALLGRPGRLPRAGADVLGRAASIFAAAAASGRPADECPSPVPWHRPGPGGAPVPSVLQPAARSA